TSDGAERTEPAGPGPLLCAGPGRPGDGGPDRPWSVPGFAARLDSVGRRRGSCVRAGGRAVAPGRFAQPFREQRLEFPAGLAVIRPVLFLVGGSLLFWLLASLPFRMLADDREAGDAAVVYAGTAVLLCLVPTSLTLLWSSYALKQAPEQQLTAVLGGTGLRVFVVALAGFALFQWVPY